MSLVGEQNGHLSVAAGRENCMSHLDEAQIIGKACAKGYTAQKDCVQLSGEPLNDEPF